MFLVILLWKKFCMEAEAYSELSRTSVMKFLFAKITCLRESSIVDVRLDSKYASGKCTRSLLHVKRKIGLPICYVPFTCEKKNRTTKLLCDISFNCFFSNQVDTHCAWKLSRYGVISGPYFPVFGLNTKNTDQK